MNKKSIIALIVTAVLINIISVLYIKNNCFYVKAENKNDTEKKYRVAIITPTTHPSLEKIEDGFTKTLKEAFGKNAKFKTYNANAKKTLMLAYANDIATNNYDVVFTIGAGTTIMTKGAIEKNKSKIPIVFGAVSNPENHGLNQRSSYEITGITDKYNPSLQARIFSLLSPSAKKLTIIYDPSQTPELERDSEKAKLEFGKYGIEIKKIPVFSISDISQKIANLGNSTDGILVLTDNAVVSALDLIVKKCNQNGITLIASDLDSGTKGAALAVGVNERSYGEMAGLKAVEILKKNVNANKIPFSENKTQRIQINTNTIKKQNLNIPENIILLTEFGQTQEANKLWLML